MSIQDRKKGCLFGLAVGDALGASIEFMRPGTFTPITTYQSGVAHDLNAGEWTDDTSMALALADSLKDGWDANDQLNKYVEWMNTGRYSVNGRCFDIGNTCRTALLNFIDFGDSATSGVRLEGLSGNGCIMRLAPVPIKYADLFLDRWRELMVYGDKSSATTHASLQCRTASSWLTVVLAGLINGVDRDVVLNDSLYMLPSLHPNVMNVVKGSYREKNPPDIKGGGYVVDSLEAALWAFYKANNFREAVLAAVNLGDDADTTGAVCGQLAGAYWGYEGIPQEWRDGLAKSDYIQSILNGIM